MKKEVMNIQGVKKPSSPFNHVVKAGNTVFLTSQLSSDLAAGEIVKGNIGQQTKRAMENIKFLLEKCDCVMDDIVKVVIYLKNINDLEKVNSIYGQYFSEGQEPARVTIQAVSPIKGIDIEIEAVAVQSGSTIE